MTKDADLIANSPISGRSRLAKALGVVIVLTVTATVLAQPFGGSARAVTQIVTSAFTGPDNGVEEAEDDNWSVSGNENAVGQSLPEMVDGPDSNSDVDRLRLTNTVTMSQTGYALYDIAQTTSAGLDISFNVAMHGSGGTGCPVNPSDNYNATSTGGANSGNSCQADGFVFYLKDGDNTDTGGTSLGSPGGSLGYSPISSNGVNGLSGALLGVGLDAYGNFYQQPFGGTGCSNDPSQSTSQFARRSLIVRGPQDGTDRNAGFCRIETNADRTASSRNIGVDISGIQSGNLFTSTGAAVRITIDTEDTANQRSNGTGKIYFGATGTSDWSSVTETASFELPQALSDADTFKFGFVAGTGGGTMNTDIWSTSVSSIRDIDDPEFTTTSPICAVQNNEFSLQLGARLGVAPYTYSLQSGTLPAGLTLTSAGLLSGTPTTVSDSTFTLRVSDDNADTGNTDEDFTINVLGAECDTRIEWSLDSTSPNPPTGNNNDGTCSSGNYAQTSDGNYRIATFTVSGDTDASCTWTPPTGVTYFEVMVVGGGGGGGFDAGGGGGGGGFSYHSSLAVSETVTVTVGRGGAAGSEGSYSSGVKNGETGGNSSVATSALTIRGNGGEGGRGCNWNGSFCSIAGEGNNGGAGGTASNGTINLNGGSGGDGVWTSSGTAPQSGTNGNVGQTAGASVTYGCGAGGSGAGQEPGAGGCGTAPAGTSGDTAPESPAANSGSGGGGGNGPASAGAAGIVVLKYSLDQASNDSALSVDRTFTGESAVSTIGTIRRQWATWSANDGCGDTWTSDATSITSVPDSSNLTRSRCYRWTFDTGIDSSSVRPVDAADFSPISSLTSPIVIIPPEATVNAPTVIPVDPRATNVTLPAFTTSGPEEVLLCYFDSGETSLTGIGTIATSPTQTFDTSTIGSAQTDANNSIITGDTTNSLSIRGTLANVDTTSNNSRVVLSSGTYSTSKHVLIRVVPVVQGFTSTCQNSGANLIPIASGSRIIEIKPLELGAGNTVTVPIGRQ